MTKAKIVFFDFAVALGGSVVVLANTLKAVDRNRYDPVVVTALPAAIAREVFGSLGVPIILHHHLANYVRRFSFIGHPIFKGRWRRRLASYLFTLYSAVANALPFVVLAARIARLRPCMIHTNNAIDSMLIARLFSIPAVLHLHGPFAEESRLEVALARQARKCLCVSQGIADMLASRGVDRAALEVLPNPSPVPQYDSESTGAYRKKFAADPDSVLIAHIGRLVSWKGQKEFLLAFAKVQQKLANVRVLIVGDDVEKLNGAYVEELHRLVRDMGLEDRVTFTGHIGDIQNLVAGVDIVIHSSTLPEPFGLVVTEAMALGKPVIAANHGATAEIVEHERTGLLADPQDADELGRAIFKLASNRSMREVFGNAARIKAEREYSLEKYGARLQAIYESVGA